MPPGKEVPMGVHLSVAQEVFCKVFSGTDLRGSILHTLKQFVKGSLHPGAKRIPKTHCNVQGHFSQSVLTAEGSANR